MTGETPAWSLEPGTRVAGYTVEERIGVGGMAVVYRARDEHLRRTVALKVMMPRWSRDRVFRQRFTAEASAAATVDHPNVIPVHEAGEARGVLFIAMRLVSGGDLNGVLRQEGLPPDRVIGLLEPVASALDAVHAAGLVHRDIKPANILLDPRPGEPDHVYVSDFGLIKSAAPGDTLTPAGQYVGTPLYSAPEQAEGKAVDGRADQYSLACVAFELLSGRRVFERDQPVMLLMAHRSAEPPALSEVRPGLPEAVDPVLARALAKAPMARYPSCGAFLADLRAALAVPPEAGSPKAGRPPRQRPLPGGVSPFPALAVAVGAAALAAAVAVPVSLAVLDGQHATAAPSVTAAPSASPVAATVTTGHGALLDTLAVSGSSRVSALAFAPRGVRVPRVAASDPLLAVADGGPGGGVYLWSAAPARVVMTFTDPRSQGFRAVAFSADGLLAAVGNDGSVDVWNIDSRALDDRIPPQAADGRALSVAFSAGTLAVGDRSGTTLLWDETAGDFSASSPSLVGPADSGGVTAVAFASDGTLAAGYSNGDAYVWDTFVSSPTISYAEYGSAVTSAAWADDAGTLAVAHTDGQVSLSQWTNGEPGESGPGESPVGYAVPGGGAATAAGWTTIGGDSMFAAGAAGGTTYVWDDTASTGPVKDAGPRGVSVTALSFAPGGTTMATGGSDGKVRLWRVTADR